MSGAGRAYQFCKRDDAFTLGAAAGARQAHGEMFRRGLWDAHEYANKSFGHLLGDQGFLDKFRNAIIDANTRAQTLDPTGARFLEIGEGIKRLLHGAIVAARGRFLTEAD